MPDISLIAVDKSYDNKSLAVDNLNLQINDGDFMCLLGPSGCGKTTTLRMIAGLENTSDGEIIVGDRVLDSRKSGQFVPPDKRGMGLVFQSYALWPHLTIERNTDFGLRLKGMPKEERQERVNHVMKTLGIEQYRDRYPSQLSGGQQQRVALARMLVVEPDVLLLDEPLSNLDARLRLEMRAELKRIHNEFGTTIIFVTHDQWEALTLATRIAVMHNGELLQVGSPEDIYDRPASAFVAEFVGNPPINMIEFDPGRQDTLTIAVGKFIASCLPHDSEVGQIGLRPESIRLSSSQANAGNTQITGYATLSAILPTGGSWIIELDVDGTTIFMTSNALPNCAVGEKLIFTVEHQSIHVFDKTGIRITQDTSHSQRAV